MCRSKEEEEEAGSGWVECVKGSEGGEECGAKMREVRVRSGEDGKDGEDGEDGEDGGDGEDGERGRVVRWDYGEMRRVKFSDRLCVSPALGR